MKRLVWRTCAEGCGLSLEAYAHERLGQCPNCNGKMKPRPKPWPKLPRPGVPNKEKSHGR